MKYINFLLIMVSISYESSSQETTINYNTSTYLDFTKSGFQQIFWTSYDINKFSIEGRYNYDWDKNISLYIGWALKHNDWKFRLMQGITSDGENMGFGISPLSIYESKKMFLYNSPQVVFGYSKIPTYFFHWGEIYYKPKEWFWFGVSDRLYFDNENSQDISIGTQVSFAYKGLFINFYYWLPTTLTDNRFSILLGYERSTKRQQNKK